MMGMGEPLYNFDNVKAALAIVIDGDGLALSQRRITLSTAGVVPMIPRAGEEIGSMLAISLHAVRDEMRDVIVPINKKYPIAELLEACRNYPGASNARRITFEYVMLKGVNDSLADARELVKLLDGHSRQDQPDPLQSLARVAIRMLRLGADREIRRDREPRGLCVAGAHAARPRHHGRLRPAEKRKHQGTRQRAAFLGSGMRDQYAGDVSDYLKFSFLKTIVGQTRQLGIAWYYCDRNDGRADGRHRETSTMHDGQV